MPHFIFDACTGCGICEPVCPTEAITGISKEIYDINPDRCIDCGVCGKYCPSFSIQDKSGGIIKNIKHKEMPKAYVLEENCTGCVWCVDVCPFDCIVMADSSVERDHSQVAVVNQGTCVGCRLCEEICNKGAIIVPRHGDESDYMVPMMPEFVVSPLRAY
ncbi:MAG: 4Fe-4S binding protein [bacterium]